MIKHYCDRCGKEIPKITLYNIGDTIPETMRLGDYELCPDCRNDFRKWIKRRKNDNVVREISIFYYGGDKK